MEVATQNHPLRYHLSVAEAKKIADLRAKLGQAIGTGPPAAVDEAGDATAVLLRDVHCALLLAAGTGKGLGAVDARRPGSATISSPEEHSPSPWTLRTAQAVLAAPLDVAPEDSKVLRAQHGISICVRI